MNTYRYIIITPAKNEEKFIEKTIHSVINQTVLPLRWIIVDDGSTDGTAEIVKKYINDYSFIKLVQREKSNERHFGNKVYAIRRGFEEVKDIDYDFYCNLDADVSFEPDYFELLFNEFNNDPKLGIIGGRAYYPVRDKWKQQEYSSDSVPGFTQLFRRNCYEQTGGYLIFKYGNEDGYVEIKAKSLGWQVKTFDHIRIFHHRITGTNWGNVIKRKYISGKIEYYYRFYYPYHVLRALSQLFRNPFIIGTLAYLSGYLFAFLKFEDKINDKEFQTFLHKEQKNKLLNFYEYIFSKKT